MPRLDQLLARNSPYSRRDLKRLFRSNRVRGLDGTPLNANANLTPSALPQDVRLDEHTITLRCRYDLLLHKPLGVVTAHQDDRHPTAYALLEGAPLFADLRAVGRLDKETSGLLMWTTDGTLLHRLTHPRYAVPRTYHVALEGPFSIPGPGQSVALDDGYEPEIVELTERDPEELHPALHRPEHATHFASVTITTGRFHEVRRLFAALGSHVVGLARVRFGVVELPKDLAAGAFVEFDLKGAFAGLSPRGS